MYRLMEECTNKEEIDEIAKIIAGKIVESDSEPQEYFEATILYNTISEIVQLHDAVIKEYHAIKKKNKKKY